MLQTPALATGPDALDGPPLPGLMLELVAALRRRSVRYCPW